eukprot:6353414-Amphidinium_carterae.1
MFHTCLSKAQGTRAIFAPPPAPTVAYSIFHAPVRRQNNENILRKRARCESLNELAVQEILFLIFLARLGESVSVPANAWREQVKLGNLGVESMRLLCAIVTAKFCHSQSL